MSARMSHTCLQPHGTRNTYTTLCIRNTFVHLWASTCVQSEQVCSPLQVQEHMLWVFKPNMYTHAYLRCTKYLMNASTFIFLKFYNIASQLPPSASCFGKCASASNSLTTKAGMWLPLSTNRRQGCETSKDHTYYSQCSCLGCDSSLDNHMFTSVKIIAATMQLI